MAQASFDFARIQYERGEFRNIQYIPLKKTVRCEISDNVTLKIKKTCNGITVMIRNASKFVTLPNDTFNFICNSQERIQFLMSFLEQ